ncbi:MAG: carbohydrate binding family 9 domain-containing protein [Sphingobacteriaceae bacterium]|nr:carbohydrate binding family 9 domain-containing protein [Sphingobacteriaceae bacterium]
MNLKLKSICFFSVVLLFGSTNAQTVKKLKAVRTDQVIKIDGNLDDEAWKSAESGTGFIEFRPTPGIKEKEGRTTEVRVLYDDAAVYVYARMNEVSRDSIARQVVPRDQIGNADFIGVVFDTYLDRINGNGFYVTAAGSQYDAKYSQTGNEDSNWNAVWFSEVKIDDKGWSAEMKIPYSALRFSSKDVQTWGINFIRRRQIFNQEAYWNSIDPKLSGFINQEGELTNIEKIKAPLRLSLSPYISSNSSYYPYTQQDISNFNSKLNGGMDIKYGISDAFTLDMTLVPDFGQVQSDNRVLNLSPFDVRFNEQRQFFTEGTEMFNKGDLFYSRRVGIEPSFGFIKGGLGVNEKVLKKPNGSKLINATKVSGRSSKGLGIGVFNAVTNRMFASIADTVTGAARTEESQPLTNYSILVLDQSLKNNSSVTFLNTNVLRNGSSYDANVSAFLMRLNDKRNRYFIEAETKVSHRTANGTNAAQTGLNYEIEVGKQSGNFLWAYEQQLSDKHFNTSDLGFFTNNNFLDHELNLIYNIYKPGKWFNKFESWVEFNYSERLSKRAYQSFAIYPGIWVRFKNFWTLNINSDLQSKSNNFYEARSAGRLYQEPSNHGINANFDTNRSKKFQVGGFAGVQKKSLLNGWGWGWGTWQTYRINDKLAVSTEMSTEPRFDYVGWVENYKDEATNQQQVIFSRYDRQIVSAILNTTYTFSPRMGISFRARHYWSERENRQYYSLNNDGTLIDFPSYTKNKNQNYNTFNIDMIYTWQFAPGSELAISYKDAAEVSGNDLRKTYDRNFASIISSPQNNTLSVKMLYYIDYLDLKKRFK